MKFNYAFLETTLPTTMQMSTTSVKKLIKICSPLFRAASPFSLPAFQARSSPSLFLFPNTKETKYSLFVFSLRLPTPLMTTS
jgi:hypothetical protein